MMIPWPWWKKGGRPVGVGSSLARLAVVSAVASALAASGPAHGQPVVYKIEPGSTIIEFEVDVLDMAPTSGAFQTFSGQLDLDLEAPQNSLVDVDVDAGSAEMGWEPADSTIRSADFLDVAHYHDVKFITTAVHVDDNRHVTISGDLTLRGVTKPMELKAVLEDEHYDTEHSREEAEFSVTGHLSRADFGMSSQSGLIGDEVRLHITSRLVLNSG